MPVTSFIYPCFTRNTFLGNSNTGDTFKIMLLDSLASFNPIHTNISSLSFSQITGTNYTAGGNTCTITATSDTTGTIFTISSTTWSAATLTAYAAAIYKDSTEELCLYIDFGEEKNVLTNNFIISGSGRVNLL